jgi:hypothetical protein
MRVQNEFKNVDLVVKGDGEEIRRISKRHMAPAEMEKVILAKKMLQPYQEITIEVV